MILDIQRTNSRQLELRSVVFSGQRELEVVGAACEIMAYDGLYKTSWLGGVLLARGSSRRLIIAERALTTSARRVLHPSSTQAERVIKEVDRSMDQALRMPADQAITPRLRLEDTLARTAIGCIYDYAETYAYDNEPVDRLTELAGELTKQASAAGYIPGVQHVTMPPYDS